MNALQSVAQIATSQMVNCLAVGIAITAFAGIFATVAGRKSSGLRFAIWFAALLALVSLFFLSRPISHPAVAAQVGPAEISLRPEWALYIFGVWAFFASLGLARVARGLWRVRALKKSCVPVDSGLAASVHQPPTSRRFALCTSASLRVPAALGFFRPMIVLPAWSVSELSAEELKTVVLHEAAHLQRWDDWTNLFQKIVRALLFFHPAVWWIDSRLSIEREMSCDDLVLAQSQSARQYAACLISLAEKTQAHRSLALVQAAVSHVRHTAKRISKILDGNQRTAKPLLKPAFAAATVFAAVSLIGVQHTPQLVSFRNEGPGSSASADKFDYVANPSETRAAAIPASMHLPSARSTTGRVKAQGLKSHNAAAPRVQRPIEPAAVPTQNEEALNRFEKRPPAAVNAAMGADATPSFIYLVTQTEQYDDFGRVIVTTSVWRIRVIKPAPAQVQNAVLPNRT